MKTLSKTEYTALRKQLDFTLRPGTTVAMLGIDLLFTSIALLLLVRGGPVGFFASQLLFSALFFRNFCLLHECGHGIATRSTFWNTVIGHYTSLFCFLPYYSWQFSHTQHHAWSGNLEKDPSLKMLKDEHEGDPEAFARRLKHRVITVSWLSWVPLLGLSQHVVFWLYFLKLSQNLKRNARKLVKTLVSILFLAGTYTALHLTMPAIFNFGNFWIAIVLFFVWVELINFPHHLNLEVIDEHSPIAKFPAREQSRTTRSCYYPSWFAMFFLYNFNFHVEHHLFPKLPWHQLRHARNLVSEALGEDYHEETGIHWNLVHRKIADIKRCFLSYRVVRKVSKTAE